ncbi:exonuclease domain-containing protein [Luteimonas sp. A478]
MLDLEATCDDQGSVPRDEMEIIEIGAVLLEPGTWLVSDEFNAFVRPVRHPRLTPFCTQLTSITQADFDPAPGFVDVVARLQDWLRPIRLTAWGSWGNYDRRQIQQDADFHDIGFPIQAPHFNLKDRFTKRLKLPRRPGLGTALGIAGLAFQGTHHRAIDDARNIARLMPLMYGTSRDFPPPCGG